MEVLPPPVSLDGVPLPPLPDRLDSIAAFETNIGLRRECSSSKIPEKDDSSAESAPEALPTGSTGIKRPLNRYFLYKVWAQPYYVKAYPGRSNQIISKLISRDWHNRSDQVKDHFEQLAVWEKAKHAQRYPNYKYQPKMNRSGKKKLDRKETEVKLESAKPPMQSLNSPIPASRFNNLGLPRQFEFPFPNQYDVYGNPNDLPLYPGFPKIPSLSPDGVDQYLQQLDMGSASIAATPCEAQFQQSDMQPFHSWPGSSRGSHGACSGDCHSSASNKYSLDDHHSSKAFHSPFPDSSADSDADISTTYQSFMEFQRETLASGQFRISENANISGSSGSEASDSCTGEIEYNDVHTTVYDDEIELLQQRLLQLRWLKLKRIQQKARRHIDGYRRSSNSSDSNTISESGVRPWENASNEKFVMESNKTLHFPPSVNSNDTFERSTALLGSRLPYTRELDHYLANPKVDSNSVNPPASSESSFNIYDSLSPLTVSAYLSNAIAAEDTTGYLRQLLGDEPVEHTLFHS